MSSISTSDAQLINIKQSGNESVTHKPALEEEHLRLNSSKAGLFVRFLHTVPFKKCLVPIIVLFFCRRGCEGQRAHATTKILQFFRKPIQILLTIEKHCYRQQFLFVVNLLFWLTHEQFEVVCLSEIEKT